MSRRIEKTRRAGTDIDEAFTYPGERNWDAAQHFLLAVESDCHKLAEMPGLGARRLSKGGVERAAVFARERF